MKTKVIFILCMIFSVITMGQITKEGAVISPPRFTAVKAATPINSAHKALTIENYMLTHVTYPDAALRLNYMGTEVVAFNILPNGEIADIKVINSVHPSIDKEVIAVLKTTNGMWKPGSVNDEPVAMEKEISVVFRFGDRSALDDLELAKRYFIRGSKNLLTNQKPKQALKDFNNGVLLLPNEKSLLVLRGLTLFALGDKEGAMNDWTRVRNLGGVEGKVFIERFITMKGYEQMALVLESK